MLEFVGVIGIVLIAFLAVKFLLKVKSTIRSKEMGIECKYIAIREFGVPEIYYTHSVVNHMDSLKRAALEAKSSDSHRTLSWPRLLALGVFTGFRNQCERLQRGDLKSKLLFERLKITPEAISKALAVDVTALHAEQLAGYSPRNGVTRTQYSQNN